MLTQTVIGVQQTQEELENSIDITAMIKNSYNDELILGSCQGKHLGLGQASWHGATKTIGMHGLYSLFKEWLKLECKRRGALNDEKGVHSRFRRGQRRVKE